MKISQFESAVWKRDRIRIVVRGEANDEVGDYDTGNAARGNFTLRKFIDKRIKGLVADREVFAINGRGDIAPKHTTLITIRETYTAN